MTGQSFFFLCFSEPLLINFSLICCYRPPNIVEFSIFVQSPKTGDPKLLCLMILPSFLLTSIALGRVVNLELNHPQMISPFVEVPTDIVLVDLEFGSFAPLMR